MYALTRILPLAIAVALVALVAFSTNSPVQADDRVQSEEPTGPRQSALSDDAIIDCHQQRRAISRRACQARLDKAENE
jgi:poly-D-alanine transfer protein DltD